MSLVDLRTWTPGARSVAEAVHRFLVDVGTTHSELSVTAVVNDLDDSSVEITLCFDDDTRIGGGIPADGDDEDVCARVADRLQDMMIEYLVGGWPECPGHGHPATCRRLDTAAWVCPMGGAEHFAAPVGRYPHKVNASL